MLPKCEFLDLVEQSQLRILANPGSMSSTARIRSRYSAWPGSGDTAVPRRCRRSSTSSSAARWNSSIEYLASLRVSRGNGPSRGSPGSRSVLRRPAGSLRCRTRQRRTKALGSTRSSLVVMMTSGNRPWTLTGFGLAQGSELAGAEGFEQPVGDVGVGLVDLVDQHDAAVGRIGSIAACGCGSNGCTPACSRASFQSKAHQSGPGRTNRPVAESATHALDRDLGGSPDGPRAGLPGSAQIPASRARRRPGPPPAAWTASNSQSRSRDSVRASTTFWTSGRPSTLAAAAASWVLPTPGSPRTRSGRQAPSAARIASALSGSNWWYCSGKSGAIDQLDQFFAVDRGERLRGDLEGRG